MTKLTEKDIELWAIEELESIGYNYKNETDIAPDSDRPDISTYLLLNRYTCLSAFKPIYLSKI